MESQNYLTKLDLRVRGWRNKSIKYFLGSPDKLKKNSSKSVPTQLFCFNRVLKCEEQSNFTEFNQNIWKGENDSKGLKEIRKISDPITHLK